MIERVFVVTYCRRPELYYGTSMIFDTIRTGFPDSEIVVIDNASKYGADKTQMLAYGVDAKFIKLDQEKQHHAIIADIVANADVDTAIVDPDIAFWDRADESGAMLEGRLIPTFNDPYSKCITHKRLHTSFIRFTPELKDAINAIHSRMWDWQPFTPTMLNVGGVWNRWDTMASLYAAIDSVAYDEATLNKYDHLFCGSHIDLVAKEMGDFGQSFQALHTFVKRGQANRIKGCWTLQDEFFNKFSEGV